MARGSRALILAKDGQKDLSAVHCLACGKRAKGRMLYDINEKKVNVKERNSKKAKVLQALSVTGTVNSAARASNLPVSTVYQWIKQDPHFAAQVDDAKAQALGLLETELVHRAVTGDLQPVVSAGKLVTYQRKKSDDLLKLALAAQDPKRYSNRGRQLGMEMGEESDGKKYFKVYEGFNPDDV